MLVNKRALVEGYQRYQWQNGYVVRNRCITLDSYAKPDIEANYQGRLLANKAASLIQ